MPAKVGYLVIDAADAGRAPALLPGSGWTA